MFIILTKGRERERETSMWKKNINPFVASRTSPDERLNPQPMYVPWPGNQSCNLSIYGMTLQPPEPTGQGSSCLFIANLFLQIIAYPSWRHDGPKCLGLYSLTLLRPLEGCNVGQGDYFPSLGGNTFETFFFFFCRFFYLSPYLYITSDIATSWFFSF